MQRDPSNNSDELTFSSGGTIGFIVAGIICIILGVFLMYAGTQMRFISRHDSYESLRHTQGFSWFYIFMGASLFFPGLYAAFVSSGITFSRSMRTMTFWKRTFLGQSDKKIELALYDRLEIQSYERIFRGEIYVKCTLIFAGQNVESFELFELDGHDDALELAQQIGEHVNLPVQDAPVKKVWNRYIRKKFGRISSKK